MGLLSKKIQIDPDRSDSRVCFKLQIETLNLNSKFELQIGFQMDPNRLAAQLDSDHLLCKTLL